MMQSIRKFKNNDELIKDLEEERKLIFPDNESKQIFKSYLIQYGYFSFVKKMSNDLMYSDVENKIFKEEFTSNNLRYLFDIDRNISVVIFKYFRNIEFLLNSAMLKIIAKKLNKYAGCPYIAALNNEGLNDLFPNIDKEIPQFKKYEKNTYANFYDDIFKNLNNIDFDCREAIEQNKTKEKNEIKEMIEKGWFKSFINNHHKKTKKDWEYLDIFSLFQTLNFSQLIRIYSYLSVSLKNEVIKEFFTDYKANNKHLKLKEKHFYQLINAFANLRNILMHNGCLIKFNTMIDEDDRDTIKKYFNIEFQACDIKLNEIIKIMELIINIENKIFDEINESIDIKFKKRTNRSDKVSKLIFEIIEKESRIKINHKSNS